VSPTSPTDTAPDGFTDAWPELWTETRRAVVALEMIWLVCTARLILGGLRVAVSGSGGGLPLGADGAAFEALLVVGAVGALVGFATVLLHGTAARWCVLVFAFASVLLAIGRGLGFGGTVEDQDQTIGAVDAVFIRDSSGLLVVVAAVVTGLALVALLAMQVRTDTLRTSLVVAAMLASAAAIWAGSSEATTWLGRVECAHPPCPGEHVRSIGVGSPVLDRPL
jgi:hypothetical protein